MKALDGRRGVSEWRGAAALVGRRGGGEMARRGGAGGSARAVVMVRRGGAGGRRGGGGWGPHGDPSVMCRLRWRSSRRFRSAPCGAFMSRGFSMTALDDRGFRAVATNGYQKWLIWASWTTSLHTVSEWPKPNPFQ